MYRRLGQTPCMKFCPVQCLSGKIDAEGLQEEMHYDMAACAEMSQQYEAVPAVLADAMAAGDDGGAPRRPLRPGPARCSGTRCPSARAASSPSASSACGSAPSRPGRSSPTPFAGPDPGPGRSPEPTDDPGAHPGPARGDGRDGRCLRGDHLRAQQQPPDEAGGIRSARRTSRRSRRIATSSAWGTRRLRSGSASLRPK